MVPEEMNVDAPTLKVNLEMYSDLEASNEALIPKVMPEVGLEDRCICVTYAVVYASVVALSFLASRKAACAAASRAMGTR
jgi:hypothetical protein